MNRTYKEKIRTPPHPIMASAYSCPPPTCMRPLTYMSVLIPPLNCLLYISPCHSLSMQCSHIWTFYIPFVLDSPSTLYALFSKNCQISTRLQFDNFSNCPRIGPPHPTNFSMLGGGGVLLT